MIGFCARTEPRIGDCDAGDQGSFVVRSPNATKSRSSAASSFAGAVGDATGFRLRSNAGECGWFRDCGADNLESTTTGMAHRCGCARPRGRFGASSTWTKGCDRPHVVRWGEEGKGVEGVPVVVADDWGTSWVVGEHHHEAFVKRFVRYGASGCRNGDMLVLGVGANSGYFSMISAALGCRVSRVRTAGRVYRTTQGARVHANGTTNQVAVIHGAVGALGEYAIAPAVGCAGDAFFARDKGRGGAKDAAVPRGGPAKRARTMTF